MTEVSLSSLKPSEKIRVTWLDAVQTMNVREEDIQRPEILPFLATYIVKSEGRFLAVTKSHTGHDVLVMLIREKKKLATLAIPVALVVKVERIAKLRKRKMMMVRGPYSRWAIIGVKRV